MAFEGVSMLLKVTKCMFVTDAMLATQLNSLIDEGEMDQLCVIKVKQYICNTLQGNR